MSAKAKKAIVISVSIVVVIGIVLAIVLPLLFRDGAQKGTLDKPVLSVTGDTVSWAAVADAGSYTVRIDNETAAENLTGTSYQLPENGNETVSVAVEAVTAVETKENSVSDTLVLKRLVLDPFADSYGGEDYYCWYGLAGAGSYEVTLGGQAVTDFTYDETQNLYLLPITDAAGDTITVKAVSDTANVLSGSVTRSLSREPLQAPENVTALGALVTWDAVQDAAGYDVTKYGVYVDGVFKKSVSRPFYTHTERTDGAAVTVKAEGPFVSNASAASEPAQVVVDELTLFSAAVEKARSYKAVELTNQAVTRMTLGMLTVRGNIVVNFGRDIYSLSLAQGSPVATRALESYYAEGGLRYVRETADVDSNLTADFTGTTPWSMTAEEFNAGFGGRGAYDFIYYDVSEAGVKEITQGLTYDAATGSFAFTVSLNVPAGTEKNRFDVIEVGGLEGCTYISCDLEFVINSQMQFVSYSTHDVYEARKVGIDARTTTDSHYTFAYYNEYRDIDAIKGVSAWAKE